MSKAMSSKSKMEYIMDDPAPKFCEGCPYLKFVDSDADEVSPNCELFHMWLGWWSKGCPAKEVR